MIVNSKKNTKNKNIHHRLSEATVLNHNKINKMNKLESRIADGLMSFQAIKSFFPNIEQQKIIKYGWLRKQGQFCKSWQKDIVYYHVKELKYFEITKSKTTEDYDCDCKYYAKEKCIRIK